jgi:hypothetical protein
LLLWNNNTNGVSFDDDHGVTMTIIGTPSNDTTASASPLPLPQQPRSSPLSVPSAFSSSDLETIKFTRSIFPFNGTIVLADLAPLNIKGGHVTLNIPSKDDVKLVAVQLTNRGPEHAAIIDPVTTFSPRPEETLYISDLKSPASGMNPFTERIDTVSEITNLLLWNNNTNGVSFDDDHGVTMTIIGTPSNDTIKQQRLNLANKTTASLQTPPFQETGQSPPVNAPENNATASFSFMGPAMTSSASQASNASLSGNFTQQPVKTSQAVNVSSETKSEVPIQNFLSVEQQPPVKTKEYSFTNTYDLSIGNNFMSIGDKIFPIRYNISNGSLDIIRFDEDKPPTLYIGDTNTGSEPTKLTIEIPRFILDSKESNGNGDQDFFVHTAQSNREIDSDSNSRVLEITFWNRATIAGTTSSLSNSLP